MFYDDIFNDNVGTYYNFSFLTNILTEVKVLSLE